MSSYPASWAPRGLSCGTEQTSAGLGASQHGFRSASRRRSQQETTAVQLGGSARNALGSARGRRGGEKGTVSGGDANLANKSLASETVQTADAAMRRLLKTPKVFQTSRVGTVGAAAHRRELRSNLLPSIIQSPAEAAASDGIAHLKEVHGEFYKLYTERLEQRAKDEDNHMSFLDRETSLNRPSADPQQMAAGQCSFLGELVKDKLGRFRRPTDMFVDTTSDIPFVHNDMKVDLSEITDILTIDLERYEFPFKTTGKRPAFTSLQVASRVPLCLKDPLANAGLPLKSEPLANGLHVVRLDLQPGEVRQVAYSLDSDQFRESKLAARLSSLVSPEQGVLANIVSTLRDRESEVRAVTSVLDDVLREQAQELPGAADMTKKPAEEVDVAGVAAAGEADAEGVAADGMSSRDRRLAALLAVTKRTLSRLLGGMDALALLAAPILPSLSHALDRAAVICVREVDRVASRCHDETEALRDKLVETESERRRLSQVVERLSGKVEVTGGAELLNRVQVLETELQQQVKIYSSLLGERDECKEAREEAERQNESLRAKNRALERAVTELKKELAASSGGTSVGPSPGLPATDDMPVAKRSAPVGGRGYVPLPFSTHASTQTRTEYLFSDGAACDDALTYSEHSEIFLTAARAFKHLGKYVWNQSVRMFMYRGDDGTSIDEILLDPSRANWTARALPSKVVDKDLQGKEELLTRLRSNASVANLEVDSDEEFEGLIDSYNPSTTSGVISCDRVRDVYQRDCVIYASQMSSVAVGDAVTFRVRLRNGAPTAWRVALVRGPSKDAEAAASAAPPAAAEIALADLDSGTLDERLLRACASESLEDMRLLLEARADACATDVTGQSALMISALSDHHADEKCRLLTEHGATADDRASDTSDDSP